MKYTVIKVAVGVLFVAGYVALFCTPLGQPLERSTICPRSMS